MFLETLWFYLWGLLWAMYFVTDGFDLGVGMLLPFLGKDETTKRTLYNATGPLWDGNEVWLIAAGGVTFAAFPSTYAMMFSSFYIALTLLLVALIIRGLSFEFRHKIDAPIGKKICDICQSLGSFLIALLVGVAFANIFQGLPIDGGVYKGSFLGLLNPYGIAGGVFFISIFLLHGAVWLTIKTEGDLYEKAKSIASGLWIAVLLITVVFLAFTYIATDLFDNYKEKPILFLVLVIAVASLIKCRYWIGNSKPWNAWFSSAVFYFVGNIFLHHRPVPKNDPVITRPGKHTNMPQRMLNPINIKGYARRCFTMHSSGT